MGDKVGKNPAALPAAVFLLSAKNRRGGRVFKPPPPPSRANSSQIYYCQSVAIPLSTNTAQTV